MNLPAQLQEQETEQHRAADATRAACLRAALEAYERAGLSGLCEAGRWEMVVDSIQSLDVDAVVRQLAHDPGDCAQQGGTAHLTP
ncbi:MAG: hypothetical protein ABI129_08375 [Rhodanobacter sp.]